MFAGLQIIKIIIARIKAVNSSKYCNAYPLLPKNRLSKSLYSLIVCPSITYSRISILISLLFLGAALFLLAACTESVPEILPDETERYEDHYTYVAGALNPGETLAQALQNQGVGYSKFKPVLDQLDSVYSLRRAMPEDSFLVKVDTLDVVRQLRYFPSRDKIRFFSVNRDSLGSYYPTIDTLQTEKVLRMTEGTISGSLYQSLRKFGEGPYLIGKFTEIFQWDIDFLIDPRQGDRFSLLYEQYMLDDEFVKYGDILAAEYESRNFHKRAYRYDIDDDHAKYFDSQGEAFQKAFLRSPLNYTRITSYFSKGRYHPILKVVRPHNGVDYAAPHGTPVVAASDGVISHVGWKGGHPTVNGQSGGYGKTVMIRHKNNYETLYGHLSRYEPGIRKGTRVYQNEVIGYVGQTGLATGPHLHYTVYYHGEAIDPLKMENVAGPPVPDELMDDFGEVITELDRLMDEPCDRVGISLPVIARTGN